MDDTATELGDAEIRFAAEAGRVREALQRLNSADTKNNRRSARLAISSARIALQEAAELVKGDGK